MALVCNIQETYLQVQIPECDRKYFRFLWRDVDQSKEPCVFEFQRVIFGGNASPFQAQYVSRENAKYSSHSTLELLRQFYYLLTWMTH